MKRLTKWWGLLLLLAASAGGLAAATPPNPSAIPASTEVTDLRCELLKTPLDIDVDAVEALFTSENENTERWNPMSHHRRASLIGF